MRKATIQDLKLELWLRQRNSGSIIWNARYGTPIPIKDMNENHLANTLSILLKQKEEKECFKDIMACDENDIL